MTKKIEDGKLKHLKAFSLISNTCYKMNTVSEINAMTVSEINAPVTLKNVTKFLVESNTIDDPMSRGIRKSHTMEVEGKLLELFCSDNPPQSSLEYHVRGMVFCGDNVVLRGFPYSKEHVINGSSNPENFIEEKKKGREKEGGGDWVVTEAIEGTLIRVFYFNNKWMITTHRKLDAYKSKWGNEKSFGDLFKDAVLRKTGSGDFNDFLEDLNKNFQYTFLITATEATRFVCNATNNPIVYLYAITDKTTTMITADNEEMKKWNEWKQPSLDLDFNSAVDFVRGLTFPFKCQGVIFFNTKTLESHKLVNAEYQEYFDIRGGNIPSVPFAYLHIMGDQKKIEKFRKIISDKDAETIDKYDKVLSDLVVELHQLYIKRYIEKDHEMKTDQTKHKFLLGLHEWFKTEREEKIGIKIKVTQKVVETVLFSSDPPVINKLIREKIRPPTPNSSLDSRSSSASSTPNASPMSSTNNSPVRER